MDGRGSVVTDSTSLRTLGREESLNAHENAEIEVWVSEVEFMDGSRWKSPLMPKLNREKKYAYLPVVGTLTRG